MSAIATSWWKGTFPSWMVAGLLAVNCFFVKRFVEQGDQDRREIFAKLWNHEVRLQVMESVKARASASATNVGFNVIGLE